jgi:flagellar basal body-associated protein FliL
VAEQLNLDIPAAQQTILESFKKNLGSALKTKGKTSMKREIANLDIG